MADRVVAAVARTTALGTEISLAVRTIAAAVGAQSDFTSVAIIEVVASAGIAAVRATLAIPVGEPDIGAPRVVVLQYLLHEQKEIAQPPLSQSVPNRYATVPFTKPSTMNMWMSHFVITGGRIRLQRDDLVRLRDAQITPVENDLERP